MSNLGDEILVLLAKLENPSILEEPKREVLTLLLLQSLLSKLALCKPEKPVSGQPSLQSKVAKTALPVSLYLLRTESVYSSVVELDHPGLKVVPCSDAIPPLLDDGSDPLVDLGLCCVPEKLTQHLDLRLGVQLYLEVPYLLFLCL